jgi:hypothetical protein
MHEMEKAAESEADSADACVPDTKTASSFAQPLTPYDHLRRLMERLCPPIDSAAPAVALTSLSLHNPFRTCVGGSDHALGLLQTALRRAPALTHLSLRKLSGTSLRGFEDLLQAMHHHPTLTRLDLSNNRTTPALGVALQQLLLTNITLLGLNCARMCWSAEFVLPIFDALTPGAVQRPNTTLLALDASHNGRSGLLEQRFQALLARNTTLTSLRFRMFLHAAVEWPLGAQHNVLLLNHSLTELSMGVSAAASKAVQELYESTANTTLRRLLVSAHGKSPNYLVPFVNLTLTDVGRCRHNPRLYVMIRRNRVRPTFFIIHTPLTFGLLCLSLVSCCSVVCTAIGVALR